MNESSDISRKGNKNPPSLQGDILMSLTGFGSVLVLVFAIVGKNFEISDVWIRRVDMALSMCVMMFFLKVVKSISIFVAQCGLDESSHEISSTVAAAKGAVGVSLVVGMIVGGIWLAAIFEKNSLNSVLILALALVVSGTEMMIVIFKWFGGKNEGNQRS